MMYAGKCISHGIGRSRHSSHGGRPVGRVPRAESAWATPSLALSRPARASVQFIGRAVAVRYHWETPSDPTITSPNTLTPEQRERLAELLNAPKG
jgi:hypothetical protein